MKISEPGKGQTENTYGRELPAGGGAPSAGVAPPGEVRVSVRGLVEFILRHGDIDNRRHASPDGAMQEGGRIHRMIQRRMGAEYRAEVPLKLTIPAGQYLLTVEGRADGIFCQGGQTVIDEIKGTYRELARMAAPMPLHVAQAKCYAYMYGLSRGLRDVGVRLTYCHMPTEQIKYFCEEYTFAQLEEWFGALVAAYRKWTDYTWEWRMARQASIEGLVFPFPYREGQRELAVHVYWTIRHGKKLFLEAPTGVGKTLTTLYPCVCAMGQGMGEKLFYLTAKTVTRRVADDALELLRGKGLRMKSIVLTAKEKICFMEETECNPEHCPYAGGHFDRVNDAVFALLTSKDRFTRDEVEEYARRYKVCPFEMSLDLSLFADAVICDYNYLFDPHVCLKRFFGEGSQGDYLFLVDEAHNLLERGREMYSAALRKETFAALRRELKRTAVSENAGKAICGQLTLTTVLFQTGVSEKEDGECNGEEYIDQIGTDRGRGGRSVLVRRGYAEKIAHALGQCNREMLVLKRECEQYRLVDNIDAFVQRLVRLHAILEDYLAEPEDGRLPVRDALLDFYFEVCHFLAMYELLDEHYVKYTQMCEDGGFLLKLFCVNPRENLKKCMNRGRSTVLFSATLLPIQYYKKLLGGDEEDYEVYARSVFSPAKRALLVAGDVTSRYSRRTEEEYANIVSYIEEIVRNRHGNYMVFGPSHAFLRILYEKYTQRFGEGRECVLQEETMGESDREAFLAQFACSREDSVLIGFCVLGGIFGEGIDLKHDSLIGVMIVGTGLPLPGCEREILRGYFDGNGEDGFDYAYRYPGMNKVLQAAGRVIRTAEDVGIIALLDERFLQAAYRRLFPREWEYFETVTVNTVAKRVERFWNEWL